MESTSTAWEDIRLHHPRATLTTYSPPGSSVSLRRHTEKYGPVIGLIRLAWNHYLASHSEDISTAWEEEQVQVLLPTQFTMPHFQVVM
jgi:hypothetical protein